MFNPTSAFVIKGGQNILQIKNLSAGNEIYQLSNRPSRYYLLRSIVLQLFLCVFRQVSVQLNNSPNISLQIIPMTPSGPQITSTPMPGSSHQHRHSLSPTKNIPDPLRTTDLQKNLEDTKEKLEEVQQDFNDYRREKAANEK